MTFPSQIPTAGFESLEVSLVPGFRASHKILFLAMADFPATGLAVLLSPPARL